MPSTFNSFGEGMMQGFNLVDTVFARRQQLSMQKQEMEMRQRQEARVESKWNEDQLTTGVDRIQRAASLEAQRFGGDISKLPEDRQKFYHDQLDSLVNTHGTLQESDAFKNGGTESTLAAYSPSFAAQAKDTMLSDTESRLARSQVTQEQQPAPQARAATSSLPNQPLFRQPAPAAAAPSGVQPTAPAAGPPPAKPVAVPAPAPQQPPSPHPGGDFLSQTAGADNSDTTHAVTPLGRAAEAVGDVVSTIDGLPRQYAKKVLGLIGDAGDAVSRLTKVGASDFTAMLDSDDKGHGRAMREYARREPAAAAKDYVTARAEMTPAQLKQLDPVMRPVLTGQLTALHAAYDKDIRNFGVAAQISATNAALSDMEAKHTVTTALGFDKSKPIPVSDALVAKVNPAAAAAAPPFQSPDSKVGLARNSVLAQSAANLAAANRPAPTAATTPSSRTLALRAPQSAAVQNGYAAPDMPAPASPTQAAPQKPPTISAQALNDADLLFRNKRLNVEQYQHFLRTGTLGPDGMDVLSKFKPDEVFTYFDGEKYVTKFPSIEATSKKWEMAQSERRLGFEERRLNLEEYRTDAEIQDRQERTAQGWRKLATRNVTENGATKNEKTNLDFLKSASDRDAKLTGKETSKEEYAAGFMGWLTTPAGERTLTEHGINLHGKDGTWSVGRMSTSDFARMYGEYRDFHTRRDEAKKSWNPFNREPTDDDLRTQVNNKWKPSLVSALEKAGYSEADLEKLRAQPGGEEKIAELERIIEQNSSGAE
jgi:hypothetical protein